MYPRLLQRLRDNQREKAKVQPKAKQEAWHTALDQIVDDRQSETYRDALLKEKRVREEAERKAKEVDATVRDKEQPCSLQSSSLT